MPAAKPFDWAAVYRACHGEPMWLVPRERRAAVIALTVAGLSGREIAKRLRVSRRTVVRHRVASSRAGVT